MAIPYASRTVYQPDTTLIDLITHAADQRAQGQRQGGAIWSGAVNSLGAIAGGAIQDYQAQKQAKVAAAAKMAAEAPKLAQEATLRGLDIQTKQAALQKTATDAAKSDQVTQTMSGTRASVLKAFQNDPENYKKAQDHFDRIDTHMATLLGEAAAGIRAFGDRPEAALAQLDDLKDQGFDPQKIAQFEDQIKANPSAVTPLVDSLLLKSPNKEHQALATQNKKPLVKDDRTIDEQLAEAMLQKDPARIQTLLAAKAAAAEAGRDPEAGAARETARKDAQTEKSYQAHLRILEGARKPLDDKAQKLGELNDIVNAATPIADSVLAAKFMTAMAGGQGSGVRVTGAEINNIKGGRGMWQGIEAKMQQFALDPTKAGSFTPEQRSQIKQMSDQLQKQLRQKLSKANDAQQALVDAPNAQAHRQIVADFQKSLGAEEALSGAVAPPKTVKYQGKEVPFSSLSPELQALVLAHQGGK